MKRFIGKCLLYTAVSVLTVLVLSAVLFLCIAPQYSKGYNASIIDKMARLRSLESPKIVLVGDSNLAYGMDSAVLEERFGMPVVNLGLHGGLGNEFHERMVRGEIGEGDVIIISHTSFGDPGGVSEPLLTWITVEDHFDLWPVIPEQGRLRMLKTLPKYAVRCAGLAITGKGNLATNDTYRRDAFNEYGDVAAYRPDGIHEKSGAPHTGLPGVSEICAGRLNRLYEECLRNKASCYITVYPVMDDGQAPSPEAFDEVMAGLEELTDCPVISRFADYYFPPEYFFNTAYHMTTDGAHARALQLADDLEAAGVRAR